MEQFEVEYLRHSLFESAKTIKAIVDKAGLIELLKNGMVSVVRAERQLNI